MSDNIPYDIQAEIIKILPAKSLIRFRSVSKQWNSFIGSSKFIAEYHTQQKRKHHLLVSYKGFGYADREYVSILDDDTFPQHKFAFNVPMSLKIHNVKVSSQGLLFVPSYTTRKALICNPSIRKSVNIDMCGITGMGSSDFFGFGVCPDTLDPKIVKITYIYNLHKREDVYEVFTVSTNAWRRLSNNLPRKGISFANAYQVAIDRFMYWLADERIYEDGGYYEDDRYQPWYERNLIVSFDITSEEFTEIYLPDSLEASSIKICNIRDSLGVVQLKREAEKKTYSVWKMMEPCVSNSFTKLYTINTNIHGFRKSSEPIAETENNPDQMDLFAYDPDSNHINYIGIPGTRGCYSVNSYIETLLLLDH